MICTDNTLVYLHNTPMPRTCSFCSAKLARTPSAAKRAAGVLVDWRCTDSPATPCARLRLCHLCRKTRRGRTRTEHIAFSRVIAGNAAHIHTVVAREAAKSAGGEPGSKTCDARTAATLAGIHRRDALPTNVPLDTDGRFTLVPACADSAVVRGGKPHLLTLQTLCAKLGRHNHACTYCLKRPVFGVDRVDPLQCYSRTNTVPACGSCNAAKSNLSLQTFLSHCALLASQSAPPTSRSPTRPRSPMIPADSYQPKARLHLARLLRPHLP